MNDNETDKKEGDRVILRTAFTGGPAVGSTGTVVRGFADILGVAFDNDPERGHAYLSIGEDWVVNFCDRLVQ